VRIVVTGATGLVGHAVARAALEHGHEARGLVRSAARAALLPAGCAAVVGDVTADPAALARALDGVDVLFHAAGLPESWQRDEAIFDRVNRAGTRNVLEAARAAGVRRVVYTSTMDVFAAPRGGTLVEGPLDPDPKRTAYERSKVAAQRDVDEAVSRGLDVVSVNPAAVYGPAPGVRGLNAFMARLLAARIPLLPPGGMSVVTADGLARAHLAASESGRTGESYLVSDAYASIHELALAVAAAAGLRRVARTAPEGLLVPAARALAPLARALRFTPLVAPGELEFLLWEARVDASKARRELGFRPEAVEDGVRRTVAWLRGRASETSSGSRDRQA
jgi:nucleoside-diphosphate-sugar epimerase